MTTQPLEAHLIKCPGCKNTVNKDSYRCPVCGCNFKTAKIKHAIKWAALFLIVAGVTGKLVMKHIPATQESGPQQAIASR